MQEGYFHKRGKRGLVRIGRVRLLTLFILALFLSYSTPMEAQAPPPVAVIPVTTPKGEKVWVEVATTPQERARGLMFRDHLPQNMGMLFIFPAPEHWTIWMKNTKISLDILWLDHKKTIVHIEPQVPSCDLPGTGCPQYQPTLFPLSGVDTWREEKYRCFLAPPRAIVLARRGASVGRRGRILTPKQTAE